MNQSSEKSQGRRVILSSLKMSVATFLSRILGLVREQAIAHIFGANALTDAFLVAYRIPNLLRDLFAEGIFSTAFVPVFTQARQDDPQTSRNLFWSTLILLTAATGVVVLLTLLFTPQVVQLIAPSFDRDFRQFQVAITLTRWMAPYLTCVAIAALMMGVLNTLRVFFVPALAPACANLVCVIGVFFLPKLYAHVGIESIIALGTLVLLGGIVQFAIQIPLLFKLGVQPMMPSFRLAWPYLRQILMKLGPGMIGFAAVQINLLITTGLAAQFTGVVSWLNYAFRLFQFPVGIFGVSISNSNLVHFSQSYKAKEFSLANESLRTSYNFAQFFMVPAMVVSMVLSQEIVHLIFQRGAFSAFDTIMTAQLFALYGLGLPFYGLYKVLVPVFYVIDRQRVPVLLSITSISLNIIFCLTLIPVWGHQVLAFGTTLSMVINSLGLAYFLERPLNLPRNFFLNSRLAKYVFASSVMGIVLYFASKYFFHFGQMVLLKLVVFLLLLILGGLVYLGMLILLGEASFIQQIRQSRAVKK